MRSITAAQLVHIGHNRRFTAAEADAANLHMHTIRRLLNEGIVDVCELDQLLYVTRKGWENIEEAYGLHQVYD